MTKPDLQFLSNHILSLAVKNDQLVTLSQLQLIMYYTLKNLMTRQDIDQFLDTAYHHDGAYVTKTGPQFKTVQQRYQNYGTRPILNFGKFHPQIDNGTNKRIQMLLQLPEASLLQLFQQAPYYQRYLNIDSPLTLDQIAMQDNAIIYQIHVWYNDNEYHTVHNQAIVELATTDKQVAKNALLDVKTMHQNGYLESVEL